MSTFREPYGNDVGYIQKGIVHDRNDKVMGYVHYNDVYQGVSPSGQLVYAIESQPWTRDPIIYKLSPYSSGSGYDAKPIGFITRDGGDMYRVYKYITPGKGQLVGWINVDDDDSSIYDIAGVALLLL